MSKYLAFSLMTITLVIGMIGGFVVAPTVTPTTSKTSMEIERSAKETGVYSDQQFLADMIAHHQDAINMSKRVLEHTSRKEVRVMAASIIELQSKEISTMNNWLVEWQ